MGLKMSYIRPDGAEHPESYWNIESILIEPRTRRARITFAGWHSEQLRRDGKPLIGNHQIMLADQAYDRYFDPESLYPVENVYALCYRLAREAKDILVDSFPPKGERDWIYRGFFDDAENVL